MPETLQMLSRDRIEKTLSELSRRMKLPLAFIDAGGNIIMSGDESSGSAHNHSGKTLFRQQAPVWVNREMVGTIVCNTETEDDEALLHAAVFCLETSFRLETEIEDLSSEIVRVYEELSLIYSLSTKLGSELDISNICQQVVEEIGRVLDVQTIAVMLLDEKSRNLTVQAWTGKVPKPVGAVMVDASEEPFAQIFERKKPMVIHDSAAGAALPLPLQTALCVPLVTDSRNIGMLIAGDNTSGKEFRSQEIKLIDALSGEIAAAIKKAQLYERIRRQFMSTVEALASAIDAKDPYTYGHSRRVAQISAAISQELGMSREDVSAIELAALLHDIGKIGTPEHILRKPGRLEAEEIEIIKKHPLLGAQILSTIDELQEVMAWVRHHHEQYDGKGYPDKSMADNIPLPARIISIADSYDAMTSDRPYRKGMDPIRVVDIMEDLAGSQFDPHVFRAFKTVFIRMGGEMV